MRIQWFGFKSTMFSLKRTVGQVSLNCKTSVSAGTVIELVEWVIYPSYNYITEKLTIPHVHVYT